MRNPFMTAPPIKPRLLRWATVLNGICGSLKGCEPRLARRTPRARLGWADRDATRILGLCLPVTFSVCGRASSQSCGRPDSDVPRGRVVMLEAYFSLQLRFAARYASAADLPFSVA